MKKYLFITYGNARIKGVQTKAINIAKHLPTEEVLIINHGDSTWLKQTGIDIYDMDFNVFNEPTEIDPKLSTYLENASVLIYCDFPANMPLSYLVFWYAYNKLTVPIVICDNIYSSQQFDLKSYALFYALSDRMLLTGLSVFEKYLNLFPKARLIPPYFSTPNSDSNVYKKKLIESLQIKDTTRKNILYITYNRKAFDVAMQIVLESRHLLINHIIITPPDITGAEKNELIAANSYLILQKQDIEGVRDLISSCDVVICKFGYQQLLESLSLGKPTITIGDSGLGKTWLDPEIQKCFEYFETYNKDLLMYLEKLVQDADYYANMSADIKNLHNNTFEGGKLSADIIMQEAARKITNRKQIEKKILLTFNTKTNIQKAKEIFNKELFLLPIIITNRFAERDFGYPKGEFPLVDSLHDFSFANSQDILDLSFAMHFQFSPTAYFGLAPLFPFIGNFIAEFKKLIQESSTIYIVGSEAENFFQLMINNAGKKQSVIYIE